MDTHMIVELIGYFSSLLVLVSFLMTSVIRLRIVNSVGAIIFTVYATIIGSYPTALMNLCLVGINMYNLYKLLKSPKHYEVICEEPEAAGLKYFLNHYAEDIKKFFPDFCPGKIGCRCLHGRARHRSGRGADRAGESGQKSGDRFGLHDAAVP